MEKEEQRAGVRHGTVVATGSAVAMNIPATVVLCALFAAGLAAGQGKNIL